MPTARSRGSGSMRRSAAGSTISSGRASRSTPAARRASSRAVPRRAACSTRRGAAIRVSTPATPGRPRRSRRPACRCRHASTCSRGRRWRAWRRCPQAGSAGCGAGWGGPTVTAVLLRRRTGVACRDGLAARQHDVGLAGRRAAAAAERRRAAGDCGEREPGGATQPRCRSRQPSSSVTITGVWSEGWSSPRGTRSTTQSVKRSASTGDSST